MEQKCHDNALLILYSKFALSCSIIVFIIIFLILFSSHMLFIIIAFVVKLECHKLVLKVIWFGCDINFVAMCQNPLTNFFLSNGKNESKKELKSVQ